MFENALTLRNVSSGRKIACKTLLSAGLIALAVVLPQIMHLALGQPGGVKWLPMYLPVLIGGCLLGTKWGFAVGVLSPMVSFMITSIMGNPMPMAAMLFKKLGVVSVHGKLMSETGADFLEKSEITFTYDTLTDYIKNRKGTDMCPMEKTVLQISDAEEGFAALKRRIDEMMKTKI